MNKEFKYCIRNNCPVGKKDCCRNYKNNMNFFDDYYEKHDRKYVQLSNNIDNEKKCNKYLKAKTEKTKKPTRAKLIKELDDVCSLVVRNRDNKCILCGGYVGEVKKLQHHHWIISRGHSNKYRWDILNGVSLCWACHIHKIHQHPTVPLLEKLKNRIIINGIATQDDIDRISSDREIAKLSIPDLEDKLKQLKEQL